MSATQPVSSSASHARHMPVSRAARIHADRSGKFSYAQHGSLIGAATTSETGLKVGGELDPNSAPKGIVVATAAMAGRNIQRADFHGAWNDTIAPQTK